MHIHHTPAPVAPQGASGAPANRRRGASPDSPAPSSPAASTPRLDGERVDLRSASQNHTASDGPTVREEVRSDSGSHIEERPSADGLEASRARVREVESSVASSNTAAAASSRGQPSALRAEVRFVRRDSGEVYVQIVDTATDEVLREYPPDVVSLVHRDADGLSARVTGLVFDARS